MAKAHLGSLEYILLHLPFTVGEQIYHVLLREAGYQTVPLDESRGDAAQQIGELEAVSLPPVFVNPVAFDTATLEKWNLNDGQ